MNGERGERAVDVETGLGAGSEMGLGLGLVSGLGSGLGWGAGLRVKASGGLLVARFAGDNCAGEIRHAGSRGELMGSASVL